MGLLQGIFQLPDSARESVYFFVQEFCVGEDESVASGGGDERIREPNAG